MKKHVFRWLFCLSILFSQTDAKIKFSIIFLPNAQFFFVADLKCVVRNRVMKGQERPIWWSGEGHNRGRKDVKNSILYYKYVKSITHIVFFTIIFGAEKDMSYQKIKYEGALCPEIHLDQCPVQVWPGSKSTSSEAKNPDFQVFPPKTVKILRLSFFSSDYHICRSDTHIIPKKLDSKRFPSVL